LYYVIVFVIPRLCCVPVDEIWIEDRPSLFCLSMIEEQRFVRFVCSMDEKIHLFVHEPTRL
jgi:hypothetical protein